MANEFVEIISQGAIGNIQLADKELRKLLDTMRIAVSESNRLNNNTRSTRGGSSPSQSANNTAANNTQIERNTRLIEQQRLAEIRLQQQRERAFDQYERRLTRETANLERSNSIYTKIQSKISQLTGTYNNLAAKKELGLRLTDREVAQLSSLENRLQRYQTVLSRVDQNIGNYRRNVGNYASGFNPLNNAIGQLAREAPNAGISFQVFAMSISNNIGQLQDAIVQLRAQNAQLIAQGQPVRSVFSQVLSSVLSFNTLLYLGIAVFLAYNKEISTFFKNVFQSAKAFDSAAESARQLNEIRKESITSVVDEGVALQNNLAIAKNTTLSYRDREIAAQNVLDQYPYWFESLGKEAILNGEVESAIRGVTDALLARALSNAAVGKITENQGKYIDLEERRLVLVNNLVKAEETLRAVQNRKYAASESERGFEAEQNALNRISKLQKEINGVVSEQLSLNDTNARLASYSLQQSEKAIGLDYKTQEQKKKAAEEEEYAATNSKEAFERTISRLESQLSLLNQETSAYGILNGQIMLVKGAYDALYGSQKNSNEETEKLLKFGTEAYYKDVIDRLTKERAAISDTTEDYALYTRMIQTVQDDLDRLVGKKEEVKKLTDEVQKYLNTFSQGFLENAKLGSLNFFVSMDEDGKSPFEKLLEQTDDVKKQFAITFTAIGNVAKEAFAFINQNSQAYFDAEASRLQRQYDLEIGFSEGSETAKAEIKRQYDEKQRELRNREARQQKELALFNIAINTAQGVTAALTSTPPNVPLSIIIGAIGAAQLALVAGREIPQYKMGTDNHKGGLAIVGDGGKHELVHQPTLGWSITPSTDTLVNLEKGSQVFPDLSKIGMFDSGLPDMVQLKGGITVSEMERVMRKTVGKIKHNTINVGLDKNGFNTFVSNAGGQTRYTNNILSLRGNR